MREADYSIEFQSVSISLSKTPILFDLDLRIPKGTIYGLLGPSGAGKTTIVKIAAGILEGCPKNSVFVLNSAMPSLQTIKRIGYMAQEEALYSDLTGKQNLVFFGALYGVSKDRISEMVEEVLDFVDLSEDQNKRVSKYSGGMKRRLSLGIALLHKPDILILDEPTVGIDPVLKRSIWNRLYEYAEKGRTVLITTHVMEEAEKCNRFAMIRNGRIIGEGSPEELKKKYGLSSMEDIYLKLSNMATEERGGHENEG